MSESAPRLVPLPVNEWGDAGRAALAEAYPESVVARFFTTGPDAIPIPNALATLMHHPGLAGPFLTYNNVLLQPTVLDARTRELVVLRVAYRARAPYEWAQHVRLAGRAGITPEEIDAIAEGSAAANWTPLEADLLAATDQCIDGYRVDDDTWNRLAQQFDERQLIEILFVVGTYTALAMVFNSLGLRLDPELKALATTPLPDIEE